MPETKIPRDSENILIFDVETTGLKPGSDRVIELCLQSGLAADATARTYRFNPGMPVSAGARAVHGITDEELKGEPRFAEKAAEIMTLFENAEVLVGYNLKFDLAFVQNEFLASGQQTLRLQGKMLVDPYQIWRRKEPRSLGDAHIRFAGTPLENSHSATADVAGTGRVLSGMLEAFDMASESWKSISDYCEIAEQNRENIGPSHHVKWRNGIPVLGFGKHQNRELSKIASEDGGSYLRWIASADFPAHVKQLCDAAMQQDEDGLCSWIAEQFGPAPRNPKNQSQS